MAEGEQAATRFAKLEEEKKAIADDIRDVFAEAKTHGFDVNIGVSVSAMSDENATAAAMVMRGSVSLARRVSE